MITISTTIEVLIDEADQLLAQAEKETEKDLSHGLKLIRQGIGKLLQAYLTANDKIPATGLRDQFDACLQLEPDFVSIEDEVEYLLTVVPEEVEPEEVVDTANEVWDFIIDLLENDFDGDDGDEDFEE